MPARLSSMELSSPSNPDVDTSARPSRRKSGRVVNAPAIYSPSGSAKRKRGNGQDVEDESSEEVEDDEDSEPAEEEVREMKRKGKQAGSKKNATKRAKTNGIANELPMRPPPVPKGKDKKTGHGVRGKRMSVGDAVGLYADVFANDSTADDIIAEWLQQYNQQPSNALSEIVNFVLRCTGSSAEVDIYDIEDPDNCTSKLADIQEELQAQKMADYPLIAAKTSTAFKRILNGFVNSLVKGLAAAGSLYDQPEIMDNIETWVATMSSAAARPFRHTATAISLSIISALCEVGKALVERQAKSLRQVEGERKKKTKINQARVEQFEDHAKQTAEQRVQLDGYVKDWFDTVFVHRYRDVDPKIRVDCVVHLGEWIMTYPDQFFDGQHLRYLGWVLSDTSAPTRHEVVKQLHKIFKDENKIPGLRVFTERFRPRIVEIAARDADVSARIAAVELLDTLRDAGLLEPDDIDIVGKLIYDAEPRVRKAVVPFFVASVEETLSSKIEELGGQEALDETWPTETEDDEGPQTGWLKLKCFAELLNAFDPADDSTRTIGNDSELHLSAATDSRFAIATQALFPKMAELKEWEVLAGYLLFDHSQTTANGASDDVEAQLKQLCKLEEKEESILLDVLNMSVKLSLIDLPEKPTTAKSSVKRSKAELLQEQEEDRETAAQHLAHLIPRLLAKFGATPETASAVLRLEHILNLEIFQDLRQDSTTYAALLDDMSKQFLSHKDANVLYEASTALRHARSFDELGEITEAKLGRLWDETTHSLVALCQGEDVPVRGGIDPSILAELASTVFRVSNLARITDCTEAVEASRRSRASNANGKSRRKQVVETAVEPVTLLLRIMGRGRPVGGLEWEVNQVEDSLVGSAIMALQFYFMWKAIAVRSLLATPTPGSTFSVRETLTALTERRDIFAASLDRIVAQRRGVDELRIAAAGTLLDLHNMFVTLKGMKVQETRNGHDNGNDHNDEGEGELTLDDLVITMSKKRQQELVRVFAAVEADFAKKAGHTLEPAAPAPAPGATIALGNEDEDEQPPADLSDEEKEPESDIEDEESEDSMDGDGDGVEIGEAVSRNKQTREAKKQKEVLRAEERLCMLASKIVISLHAGIVEKSVEKRIRWSGRRLGYSFKEILVALDGKAKAVSKAKGKGKDGILKKARGKTGSGAGGPGDGGTVGKARSKTVVEESEDESEEGEEDVEMAELEAEEIAANEERQGFNGVDEVKADVEVESVLGD